MNIGIVAHDARKHAMSEWVTHNADVLFRHKLFCTGTTGKLIKEIYINFQTEVGVRLDIATVLANDYIICLKSGPLGGDQQLGAMIANGEIDILFFFIDNLTTQPHDVDIKALSRLAQLYNIPCASNRSTADFIITSSLFDNSDYQRIKPNFNEYLNRKI